MLNAIKNNDLVQVKKLIENESYIQAKDDLALKLSAKLGYVEIMAYLIENLADIHADNDYVLKIAAKNCC
jgi:hypothetical protein